MQTYGLMIISKNFLGSENIKPGDHECNFENLDVSDDGQSYTVVVDVADFTPKEKGPYFAVGFKVGPGATKDISVRLLENDVVFYCSPGDGMGAGRDIGCYAAEDNPIPPMRYTLEVKHSGDSSIRPIMPVIKSLVFGGNDVCQGNLLSIGH